MEQDLPMSAQVSTSPSCVFLSSILPSETLRIAAAGLSGSVFFVANFKDGPESWEDRGRPLEMKTWEVLKTTRNAVAHSNLFFAGEGRIDHVYLGNRDRTKESSNNGGYKVIGCSVEQLEHFVDAWIRNVQKLRMGPSLIWQALEEAN